MTRAVALAVVVLLVGRDAEASHLRVRGEARIDGHAGRTQGKALVVGRVVDDAGIPVPSAPLKIAFSGEGAAGAVVTACGEAQPPAPSTDESGRFCVWAALPLGTYAVHVEVAATDWLAPASSDFAVDLTKRSAELRFNPEPRVVTLDAPRTSLDVVAMFDDGGGEGAARLPLELTTETGAVVGHAMTDRAGRATFAIDPHDLGPPGRGALRVRFAGNDDTMASEHVAPIERDVHVTLALTEEVEAGSPEDGVALSLGATAMTFVPTGTLEARVDGVTVGAAALDKGHAIVNATFVPKGPKQAFVELRYVPDVPWFQPSGTISVSIPLRGPSPWRQAPLAVGALLVTAWLLLGRNARRSRLDKTIVMQRPPTHEGTAGISVVHSSRSRSGKFAGRVVDAHDGSPVARARLAVLVPSFRGEDTVVSVFADDEGAFEFDLESAVNEGELVVEAPLHGELRQKLPAAGILEIALVSRRRKLLDRLVQWARKRGPPYDQRPEPTPAQVRRAAEKGMPHAAEWADAIERAAFDQGEVDARVEHEVMALDPDKPNR